MMAPKGPFKLCTVNKVPERAKVIVGQFIEAIKESYTIIHVENAQSTAALSLQASYRHVPYADVFQAHYEADSHFMGRVR